MKYILTPDDLELNPKIYTFETSKKLNSEIHPIIDFLIEEELILPYKKDYYSVLCQITTNFEFISGFKYGAICLIFIDNSVLYLKTYFNIYFKRPSDYKNLIDNYESNFNEYPRNGLIYRKSFIITLI